MTDALEAMGPDRPRYADFPDFTPDFSPGRMLANGVFGGGYFHDAAPEQLKGIDAAILKAGAYQDRPDNRNANAFGAKSGLSIEEWRKRGWIREDLDPLGWFQWFCRFHSGRRSDDDQRQIRRWLDFRNRWRPRTEKALRNMNPKGGTRQALLHWAIDPYLPEHSLGESVKAG